MRRAPFLFRFLQTAIATYSSVSGPMKEKYLMWKHSTAKNLAAVRTLYKRLRQSKPVTVELHQLYIKMECSAVCTHTSAPTSDLWWS